MKREVISNSKIKSIGYWIFSSKLEIEFESGDIIQFFKVPSTTFDWIKLANCCFKYYEDNIKWIFFSKTVEDKF